MAKLDAFSAQIVKLVREMPDEAILELVKNQLGSVRLSSPPTNGHDGASVHTELRTGYGRSRRARHTPRSSHDHARVLDIVERLVKASTGLSASEVARSGGIPQVRAAAALKALKMDKRIYQGGDRRFARYAGDPKTAEQASLSARRNAGGPPARNGTPR